MFRLDALTGAPDRIGGRSSTNPISRLQVAFGMDGPDGLLKPVAADDDEEVLSTRLDLGATPSLFERDGGRPLRSADAAARDRPPTE